MSDEWLQFVFPRKRDLRAAHRTASGLAIVVCGMDTRGHRSALTAFGIAFAVFSDRISSFILRLETTQILRRESPIRLFVRRDYLQHKTRHHPLLGLEIGKMSVENLKEYARRCANEPELRDTAKTFGIMNIDEHMNQSESIGLEWDRGDLAAFQREVIEAEGDLQDLDEEDLAKIAGGICTITAVVVVGVAVGAGAGAVAGGAAGAAVGGGASAAGDGGW